MSHLDLHCLHRGLLMTPRGRAHKPRKTVHMPLAKEKKSNQFCRPQKGIWRRLTAYKHCLARNQDFIDTATVHWICSFIRLSMLRR